MKLWAMRYDQVESDGIPLSAEPHECTRTVIINATKIRWAIKVKRARPHGGPSSYLMKLSNQHHLLRYFRFSRSDRIDVHTGRKSRCVETQLVCTRRLSSIN